MSISAVLQPAASPDRGWRPASRLLASALLLALVGGALLGVAWRLLAPVPGVQVIEGAVYLQGHAELEAAQDGWLAVVLGLAGVLVATMQAVRAREPQAARAVLAVVAVGIAGVVAWQVGQLLGPETLRHQLAVHEAHLRTPLRLHSAGVLLIGPMLCAVTRCLAALFSTPNRPS
ncbi:hypothetical protein ACPPVT_08930 [Angustibacter sp. McL0619]|uniref:hypothetical protein n=1 Tax=Angustibacter sp. McL0619 TaxID=3415676 RepID=UPI003CF5194F